MKNRIFATLCFCLLFLNAGCKKGTNETPMEAKLSSECTYDDRNTVEMLDDAQGVVTLLREPNTYAILHGNPSDNTSFGLLLPCNLPAAFRKDKLKVIFSGELKETYATEYLLGRPLKLTKLKADDN
jgi:hypothetical protein